MAATGMSLVSNEIGRRLSETNGVLCVITAEPGDKPLIPILSMIDEISPLKDGFIVYFDLNYSLRPDLALPHRKVLDRTLVVRPRNALMLKAGLLLLRSVKTSKAFLVLLDSLVLYKGGFLFRGELLEYPYVISLLRGLSLRGNVAVVAIIETRVTDPDLNEVVGELCRISDLSLEVRKIGKNLLKVKLRTGMGEIADFEIST